MVYYYLYKINFCIIGKFLIFITYYFGGGVLPDILRYQQSIAAEFMAQKDRVRFFINDAHWGEDGRYKEILLADFLKSIVPNNVGVGTGFIRNKENELTNQIDIIIYKNDYPCLFQKGDFVILMPESVLGIIEVKSNASINVLTKKNGDKSTIEKCENNGRIIGLNSIFNGIWGYDSDVKSTSINDNNKLCKQLSNCKGYLNHICFNSNIFCRYWKDGNPNDKNVGHLSPSFSYYDLSWGQIFNTQNNEKPGLAFGYFISNLLEYIYRQMLPQILSKQYFEFLYPIEKTKEAYCFKDCKIKEHI